MELQTPDQELVSKSMVDKMLKDQEAQFQKQLKLQYEYFQNMLNQVKNSGSESPSFCKNSNGSFGINLKVSGVTKNTYQNFHNNVSFK